MKTYFTTVTEVLHQNVLDKKNNNKNYISHRRKGLGLLLKMPVGMSALGSCMCA